MSPLSELITAPAEATRRLTEATAAAWGHTPEMVELTCGHDVAETRRVEEPETAYEGTGAANAQVATAAGGATTGRALARCEESPLHCAGRTERARRHVQAQERRARTATLWPRSDIWHHVIISYGRRVQPEPDGRSECAKGGRADRGEPTEGG